MSEPGLPDQILALSPSYGRGGGIEAYVREMLSGARDLGIKVEEAALLRPDQAPGVVRKLRYAMRVLVASRRLRRVDTQIFCLHPALLSLGLLSRRLVGTRRPVLVVIHGRDSWGARYITRRLLRSERASGVTVSSFTAGSLSRELPTAILHPGISPDLFEALTMVPRPERTFRPSASILSVFRLSDYEAKGGPQLVSAVESLRAAGHDVTLTIAGLDGAAPAMEADIRRTDGWLQVVRSPETADLVDLYRQADIFALATRCQVSPFPSGEGYGIVLAEAALSGLPVVAPANDGSGDAMIDGITGLRPADQSAESLTVTLQWMLDHGAEATAMGRSGRNWTKSALDPASYPSRVAWVLWGMGSHPGSLGLAVGPSHYDRAGPQSENA